MVVQANEFPQIDVRVKSNPRATFNKKILLFNVLPKGPDTNEKISPTQEFNFLQTIVDHYNVQYDKHSPIDPKNKLSRIGYRIEEADSMITFNYYRVIDGRREIVHRFSVFRSTKVSLRKIVGDLNGDMKLDVVMPVYVSGGNGFSGNYTDLHVFINQDSTFQHVSVQNNLDLSGCLGKFDPHSIHDQRLYGQSICLGPDDPFCCPSIKTFSVLMLTGNKLQFESNLAVAIGRDQKAAEVDEIINEVIRIDESPYGPGLD